MEQAKQSVSDFLGKHGQHQTDVNEEVNPAVTSETVKPHRHEETTQAVDREVHQHHYHTTVQPVSHQETLPEKHTHNVVPVEEREFHHHNPDVDKQKAATELGHFKDSSTTEETRHTTSVAPVATGEHVHHHVHEQVQPVIHKETIQPEVVHTTVPIHETHTAESKHHGMSVLPTKSLDEFKQMGGTLQGGDHRSEEYSGQPRQYNKDMQVEDISSVIGGAGARTGADSAAGTGARASGISESAATPSNVGGSTDVPAVQPGSHSQADEISAVKPGTGAGTETGLGAATDHRSSSKLTDTNTSGLGSNDSSNLTHQDRGGVGDSSHMGGEEVAGVTAGSAGTAAAVKGTESTTSSSNVTNTTGQDTTKSDQGQTAGQEITTMSEPSGTTEPSPAEQRGSTTKQEQEPNNMTGGRADGGEVDDSVQHASKIGEDPSLVKSPGGKSKLTGDGTDGSHSAVFGLTPDGHKFEDTNTQSTGIPKPTEETEKDNAKSDAPANDTSSRAPESAGVAEQMHDPRVAEKGHGGEAVSTESTTKPGAGA